MKRWLQVFVFSGLALVLVCGQVLAGARETEDPIGTGMPPVRDTVEKEDAGLQENRDASIRDDRTQESHLDRAGTEDLDKASSPVPQPF